MSSSGAAHSKARCVVCHTSYARGERFCPLDGGAIVDEQPTADPLIGRTIDDRYLVRRFIGKGGMGAVYEAEHVGLDRQVAIKFMSDADADGDLRARFRQEARAASRVVDEHVVQIFDVGVAEDGRDYIVMELVHGMTLHEALTAGPFAPARAAGIARQILLGLDAIHTAGIVHRDIKPPNVLLLDRDDDVVKLMDFGIAKSMGSEVAQTDTGAGRVVGTVHYMAPEQLSGEQVDPRADLYAVGVTLFVMLAGKLPFTGSSGTYATAALTQTAPSLATLRPEVPTELAAAIARALEKSPSARFANALEFAAALDDVAGPVQRGSRPDRARRDAAPATTPNRARAAAANREARTTPARARGAQDAERDEATESVRAARDGKSTAIDRVSARPARRIPYLQLSLCVAALALVALAIMKFRDDRSPHHEPTPAARSEADREALARAAEERGDLAGAITLYEDAFKSQPQPVFLYRIGDLYERLGDRGRAAAYLSRYLDSSPAAVDRDAVRARIARLVEVADAGVEDIDAGKPVAVKVASKQVQPVTGSDRAPTNRSEACLCQLRLAEGTTTQGCRHLRSSPPGCVCRDNSLCAEPFANPSPGDYECKRTSWPGLKTGDPCRGYDTSGSEVEATALCDYCDAGTWTYAGRDGDSCAGYAQYTKERATGSLIRCGKLAKDEWQ